MGLAREYLDMVMVQDAADVASRLILTSDIHTSGIWSVKPGKDTEIVVIAGDVMGAGMDSDEAGRAWLEREFFPWCRSLRDNGGVDVVLTAGNHDAFLYRMWKSGVRIPWPSNVTYLIDDKATVRGLKFYGMPWCENDRAGRFECSRDEMAARCAAIPSGLDVLVTHCPPSVPGEKIDLQDGIHEGSVELADAILKKKPKICVCGHVHKGSRHDLRLGNTLVMNVARVKGDRSEAEVAPRKMDLSSGKRV